MTSMIANCLTRHVRICNEEGLHLRAAAVLSELARMFPCEIRISCGNRHADAKSVWELIGLVAEDGCELVLKAKGSRSEEALDFLEVLVARGFDVSAEENCHESV
jgi:phosphocarrier protein